MGESEFDNLSVALDSTEFALRLLQKKGGRIAPQAGFGKNTARARILGFGRG
jgi:hypothetical protein